MEMNITVYTKSGCPACTTAKQLLTKNQLSFAEFDTDNPAWRTELLDRVPTIRQMPAIFINEQYVGGLAGLQAALKKMGIA